MKKTIIFMLGLAMLIPSIGLAQVLKDKKIELYDCIMQEKEKTVLCSYREVQEDNKSLTAPKPNTIKKQTPIAPQRGRGASA